MKCPECDVEMKQQDNKWWCDACVATWDFTPALRLGCAVIPLRQLLEWSEIIGWLIRHLHFVPRNDTVMVGKAKKMEYDMREVGGVKNEQPRTRTV